MLQRARASIPSQADRTAAHAPQYTSSTKAEQSQATQMTRWGGNQSRLRHLSFTSPGTALQRKLSIGASNDPLEVEADRTADHVLRMSGSSPPPAISNTASPTLRRCSCGGTCDRCRPEDGDNRYDHHDHDHELQRKSAGPTAVAEAPAIVHEVLRSSGQPLDRSTLSFFEPRFGYDFSGVRIHTDAHAAESARQVNALAYTVGSDVVFRSEQFAPSTAHGQRLLAHELTHVVQQSRNGQSAASTLRRAEIPSTPMPAAKGTPPTPKPSHQPDPNNGCYGRSVNGPGKVKAVGSTQWVLSNFDIDQHYVKKEHFDFLKNTVVPKINDTPAGKFLVMVIGEASTTADFAYNLDLSKWRANCVSEELLAAGLDDDHRVNIVARTGEIRGDLEQLLHGIDPGIGIEDSTKRMVTILLVPAGSCTSETRSRASQDFFVRVACSSQSSIRINIGVNDPSQPIYREFAWLHDPWPHGCTFIPGYPPDFASHIDFVQAAVNLRLASGDPDQIYGPSDFTGPLNFFANGANQYLTKGNWIMHLFKIGLGGTWNPESCGMNPQIVEGSLIPLGPVRCGWAPAPPGHCDFTEKKDECSDAHKMAASKRFNGHLEGASFSLKGLLDPLINKLPSWARHFVNPGGAAFRVKFGTKDPTVDPSLTRSFLFLAGGNQGGGSLTEHFKAAVAPDQDATKPSRLATENPNSVLAGSDLSQLLGKLVIHGASNKIELKTGAGTFNFFNLLCNHGGTRTYYGTLLPDWTVNCPDDIDLPELSERECKDEEDCPESTRTAGHREFTAKLGRATLASLPMAGQQLANRFGCKVGAAFLNIQSEDGPKEKRIHRDFFVVFKENDCRFTVGKANSSISSFLNHQLAIDDPDSILASSDFTPVAHLNQDGELWLISDSNTPLKFKLPGVFDPACKVRNGGWGLAVPISAVDCGPAPEPAHDSTPEVNHTDDCNHFKQNHSNFVDAFIQSIGDQDYQSIFAKLSPGAAVIPPDEYNDYKHEIGQTISPAVFIGLAPNPQGGQPIEVVAFADLRIVRVYQNGWMEVQFLSEVCAFDKAGNVVMIRPRQCLESFAHAGDSGMLQPVPDLGADEKLPAPRRHSPEKLPLQAKLAIGAVNDPLEAEADRAADHATRNSTATATPATPQLSRTASNDEQSSAAEAPDLVHQELLSSGQPLDEDTRSSMEPRFHQDLSDVRVHTGDHAAASAQAVGARAYTVGNRIVFGQGEYAPSSHAGRHLVAHELAHVVQQRAATPTVQRQLPKTKASKAPTPAPRKDYVFIMGADPKKTSNPFFTYAKIYFKAHLPHATFVEDQRTLTDLLSWVSANVTDPIGNLYIVSHGNENGTLFFGVDSSSTTTTVINLRDALHPSGGGSSSLPSVSSVIDAHTTIHIKGCDIGRTKEIVELLDEAFGGKGAVIAPTHEQRYSTDPTLGGQARQKEHDKEIADFTATLPVIPAAPPPVDRKLKGDALKQARKDHDDAVAVRNKAQADRKKALAQEEKRIKPALDVVEAQAGTVDSLSGPLFQRPGTKLFTAAELQPEIDRLYAHLPDARRKDLATRLVTPNRGKPSDQQGQRIDRITIPETFFDPASLDEAVSLFRKDFNKDDNFDQPQTLTKEVSGSGADRKVVFTLTGTAHPHHAEPQNYSWTSDPITVPDEKTILAKAKAQVNNPARFLWRVERTHSRSGITTLTVIAERVMAYLHHGTLDRTAHEHFTEPENNPDFYATSTFAPPKPPRKGSHP